MKTWVRAPSPHSWIGIRLAPPKVNVVFFRLWSYHCSRASNLLFHPLSLSWKIYRTTWTSGRRLKKISSRYLKCSECDESERVRRKTHTHTQHDANEIVFISIKTLRHRSRHPLQQIPFTTKRRKAGQEATSSHCFHRYEYLSNILTQSTFSVCLKKLLSIAVAVARWFWFFYALSCTCPIA